MAETIDCGKEWGLKPAMDWGFKLSIENYVTID